MFPANVLGLFCLAEMLEIRSLARQAGEDLQACGLPPAVLVHTLVQLRGKGAAFDDALARACEVLRKSFGIAVQGEGGEEGARLLSELPVDVLAPLLEAEDLEVPSEGVVLKLVQRSLRDRSVAAAPPAPPAPADADAPVESPAAGAEAAQVPPLVNAPLTEEDASRLLNAVRFPQLEHGDLLEALKDPVLLERGAQQRILEALSARLSRYEDAGAAASGAACAQGPRPSTLPPAPAEEAAASYRGSDAGNQQGFDRHGVDGEQAGETSLGGTVVNQQGGVQRGHGSDGDPGGPRGIVAGWPNEAAGNDTRPLGASYAAWTGGCVGPNVGAVGVGHGGAGQPLCPCRSCNAGRLLLRQRDGRWTAECSRFPACQGAMPLPSCVIGAAVDGYCAACTLRFASEVRTVTVRVGRDHGAALRLLPPGVDTLRGLCIAGCSNDSLARLGP